jgi:hypothetical protein
MSKPTNSIDYFINHPSVKGIIADLKILVENLHLEFTKLRDIIQELARRLDENKICKQDTISQVIKEILKEEISKGKISERYIENCLPTEYKRKHISKKIIETEQISVSQKSNQDASLIKKGEQNHNDEDIKIDNRLTEVQNNNKLPKNPKIHDTEFEGCSKCRDVIAENNELREIVHKNIKFHSAMTLNKGIIISKNNAKEIENANKRCKDYVYLIFDIEGNVIEIKSDIEIDKDTQEIADAI